MVASLLDHFQPLTVVEHVSASSIVEHEVFSFSLASPTFFAGFEVSVAYYIIAALAFANGVFPYSMHVIGVEAFLVTQFSYCLYLG